MTELPVYFWIILAILLLLLVGLPKIGKWLKGK